MDDLLRKQESELKALAVESKALLKASTKATRAETEARVIQMEFDMKARHREEQDELEETTGSNNGVSSSQNSSAKISTASVVSDSTKSIESKRAKAQKKKDKKESKIAAKIAEKDELRAGTGPSLREVELNLLNAKLINDGFKVKEVASDGNCLYRAIADQLSRLEGKPYDFAAIRRLASVNMRTNSSEFLPFLGFDSNDMKAYEDYCNLVESPSSSEWGGQLEIRAVANTIDRPILIYDAEAPTLTMGNSSINSEPVRLAYHRHYFALGEHYNSVEKI